MFNQLFVDMNSYFASVEQQDRPELRGRPVGVVPVMAETTCCIAASYEAKAFGVRTGTLVHEARRKCPGIRIVEARTAEYVRMHHRIIAAVDSCHPVTAVLSIDELVCELRGPDKQPEAAFALCHDIKSAIRSNAGEYMRCSIGLGPNRLLAKLATDMQKPDGLVAIRRDELPERLFPLKLTDFSGIGRRMAARLLDRGITTVEQLCQLSVSEMSSLWGSTVLGRSWWSRLRGEDLPDPKSHRSSIGHSHVLAPSRRNEAAARAVVTRLLHKAVARLRQVGYCTGALTLHLSYLDRESWSDRIKLTPCHDTLTLVRTLATLWERHPPGRMLKLGVVLTNLVPEYQVPQSLFESDRKLTDLSRAMDQLNNRFGDKAVYFGGMHGAIDSAPERIAFNYVPDVPHQQLVDPNEEILDR